MGGNTDGYKFRGTGLEAFGKKEWGKERFNEYLANYPHINKIGDLHTLEELVFQEAANISIKEKIATFFAAKPNDVPPSTFLQQLATNLNIQFKLRDKLGLNEDKKALDAYKDFELLNEKFAEYRRQNPELFATTCPECSFKFYLKRRTKDYVALKSSWFKGKVLYNAALFKAYEQERPLTKKDMSEILGVSEDEIEWMEERFPYKNEDEPPTNQSNS